MKHSLFRILIIVSIVCLSACASRGKAKDTEDVAQKQTGSQDITRPPALVVENNDEPEESDPEETVSFDEWKKQTQ